MEPEEKELGYSIRLLSYPDCSSIYNYCMQIFVFQFYQTILYISHIEKVY